MESGLEIVTMSALESDDEEILCEERIAGDDVAL